MTINPTLVRGLLIGAMGAVVLVFPGSDQGHARSAVGGSQSRQTVAGQKPQQQRIRAAAVAVPRLTAAYDIWSRDCRSRWVVVDGLYLGADAGERRLHLVSRREGGGDAQHPLNPIRWTDSRVAARMPTRLADSSRFECSPSRSVTPQPNMTVSVSDRRGRSLSNELELEWHTGDFDGDSARPTWLDGADCDDADFNRFPGNVEIADFDGHDEDCNPSTIGVLDADGDGHTDARVFNAWDSDPAVRGTDCDDQRADVHPGQVEVCNRRDDNCDGRIDEGVTLTAFVDLDGDLYGDPASKRQICPFELRSGLVTNGDDCDDGDIGRNPRAGNCGPPLR